MTKISLDEKFSLFDDRWRPKAIAALFFEPAGTVNMGNVRDATFTAPGRIVI